MENEGPGEQYKLGRRISGRLARGVKKATAVFSVRLPLEDIARIERIADEENRTPAQVVRDAVRLYTSHQKSSPSITITLAGGASVTTGGSASRSQPATASTYPSKSFQATA